MSDARESQLVLVGRPNVGKSTLFNRLTGERKAIVAPKPGTTRDGVEGQFAWGDRYYQIADTGGAAPIRKDEHGLEAALDRARARYVERAGLVLLVCDGEAGCLDADRALARQLRKHGTNIIVAVNKVDNVSAIPDAVSDFSTLGFSDVVAVSALHGLGVNLLCDAIAAQLRGRRDAETKARGECTVAVMGEPNVGKSTLFNALLGEEKAAVSTLAGTTRDPVEGFISVGGHSIQLVDTAGARRKRKVKEPLAFYSQRRTFAVVERADIVLLMFDAAVGLTRNARMLASEIIAEHCGCVLVANKWDRVSNTEQGAYRKMFYRGVKFLRFCPLVFISAKEGRNVPAALESAHALWEKGKRRVSPRRLMESLAAFQERERHPGAPRIKYAVQADTSPPHFVLFVGGKKRFSDSYLTAIRNELTRQFDLGGLFFRITVKREERKVS